MDIPVIKTEKINLTEVEIKDLNEVVYKVDDLHKQIGNIIFTKASSIEVSDLARVLHAGNEAEVNEFELAEIVHIVATNPYYKPFAQGQIVQYLNSKLKSLKEETENV
jgi:hypothetical protein